MKQEVSELARIVFSVQFTGFIGTKTECEYRYQDVYASESVSSTYLSSILSFLNSCCCIITDSANVKQLMVPHQCPSVSLLQGFPQNGGVLYNLN